MAQIYGEKAKFSCHTQMEIAQRFEVDNNMKPLSMMRKINNIISTLFNTFNTITFEELLLDWWNEYQHELSDGSLQRKISIINTHLIPTLGKLAVREITKKVLQNYIIEKHKHGDTRSHGKGLSYNTIRSHFNIIRPALDYAITQGIIYINPARSIRIPREPYEANPFTLPEVVQLLKCTNKIMMRFAIVIAFTTGMRPGEIYGLKKSDINFKQKFLSVRRSVVAPKPGAAIIHKTKTPSSRRRIDLDDFTLYILSLLVSHSPTEFLFVDYKGELLSPWYNKVDFDAAAKKAGIKGKRFYDLRHGHATYLLMHNINIKEIQERMGHSSIRMTIDTYGHLFPTIQQQSVRLLNGNTQPHIICNIADIISDDYNIKSLAHYINEKNFH